MEQGWRFEYEESSELRKHIKTGLVKCWENTFK